MTQIYFDALRGALFRAVQHEIKDQVQIGNIGTSMHDHLIGKLISWSNQLNYVFPQDLMNDLRIANGTQRILPLISIYNTEIEENDEND